MLDKERSAKRVCSDCTGHVVLVVSPLGFKRIPRSQLCIYCKEALYRIWCGVNRFGDTSAFVNTAGQLLLTRCGNTG